MLSALWWVLGLGTQLRDWSDSIGGSEVNVRGCGGCRLYVTPGGRTNGKNLERIIENFSYNTFVRLWPPHVMRVRSSVGQDFARLGTGKATSASASQWLQGPSTPHLHRLIPCNTLKKPPSSHSTYKRPPASTHHPLSTTNSLLLGMPNFYSLVEVERRAQRVARMKVKQFTDALG